MVVPLGMVTSKGNLAMHLLSHGASLTRKLLEAPESIIAHDRRFLSLRVMVGSIFPAANTKPLFLDKVGCWGNRLVGIEVGSGYRLELLFSLSHILPNEAPTFHMLYPFWYPC